MHRNTMKFLIRFTVLWCAAVLMISACSMLNVFDWSRDGGSLQVSSKFIRSIRPYPGDVDSHYTLACYFQERGKHVLALEEFRNALEIDPTYVKAYNGMGISYDSLGEHIRAVESYEAALHVDQNLDYVLNNLGYSYLLNGNLDMAIENFVKAVDLNEENARFRNNLALAYMKKGNYEKAFTEFRQVGGEAKAHHNMAQILYRNGAYDNAAEHYNKVLAMAPSNNEADLSLKAARSLARVWSANEEQEQKPSKAKEMAQNSLSPDGKDKEYYNNLGLAYLEKGLDDLAFEAFKIAEGSFRASYDIKRSADSVDRRLLTREERSRESTRNAHVMEVVEANRSVEETLSGEHDPDQTPPQRSLHVDSDTIVLLDEPVEPETAIEISNGNGVRNMARRVGEYLEEKGYKVSRLTNAENFDFADTGIQYCNGYLKDANKVAKEIPVMKEMMEVAELERPYIKVKILIGKDLVPYDNLFRETESGDDSPNPEIEISNGNGVRNMARRVGEYLEEKGYKVSRLTNAENFDFADTRIQYCSGYLKEANQVAREIPVMKEMMEVVELERPYIKVKILIGKDLVPHDNLFREIESDGDTPSPVQLVNR